MRTRSDSFNTVNAVRLIAALLCGTFHASLAHAQEPPVGGSAVQVRGIGDAGSIRGVVFDSLLMTPLRGATVMLLGRVETTTSDARGRFSFEKVPPGRHTVMFTSAEFDSLGLGVMGSEVTVTDARPVNLTIATPSMRTLWQRRCAGVPPASPDSGIVWGTIRSATTDAPLSDAIVALSWFSLRSGTRRGLVIDDVKQEAVTDAAGFFFACGIPTGFVIATTAMDTSSARGKAASGSIEYVVGNRRLQMLNLLVSADMVAPEVAAGNATTNAATTNAGVRDSTASTAVPAADSLTFARARGRATLKGIVVGDNKRPVSEAIVSVPVADTSVRTDKDGAFILGGLPAGTHTVQTRRVGYAPINQLVSLRTDSVSEIRIVSTVNVLATYNVRAVGKKGIDRLEYEQRRKQGFGYFLEGKQLESRQDVGNLLRMVPGLDVRNAGFDLVVTLPGSMAGRCKPNIFLDGMPSSLDVVNMHRPSDFRAVEAFTRGITAPAQFASFSGCGVLVFWSRAGAKW